MEIKIHTNLKSKKKVNLYYNLPYGLCLIKIILILDVLFVHFIDYMLKTYITNKRREEEFYYFHKSLLSSRKMICLYIKKDYVILKCTHLNIQTHTKIGRMVFKI